MQNNSYSVKGFLKEVKPTKTFDKFTVREFVVETEEKYPQPLAFEFYDDKNAVLDGIPIGQAVNVFFAQRGREFNGRYFVTNRAWKVEPVSGGKVDTSAASSQAPAASATKAPQTRKNPAPAATPSVGDESPF